MTHLIYKIISIKKITNINKNLTVKYKILFFSEILGAGGGGIASQRIIDCFKNHETRVISLDKEQNSITLMKYKIIRFYYHSQVQF